jgi:hypothetical protein
MGGLLLRRKSGSISFKLRQATLAYIKIRLYLTPARVVERERERERERESSIDFFISVKRCELMGNRRSFFFVSGAIHS